MLTHECKGNASYKHLSIKQENIDLYYKNKPRIFATVPKYPGKSGSVTDAVSTVNPQDNDLCILRLSEVYLNAAEAAFKIGNTEKALTYLNAIVTRANPAKSVTSADLSLERILKERRKELVGEGHAFFDYMRNGKSVDRSGGWHLTMPEDARVIAPSDPRVALPIPQTEIDANPNIVQNPR